MRRAAALWASLALLSTLIATNSGAEAPEAIAQEQAHAAGAKNVILFVGDGMGLSTITAARILQGQLRGASGEANSLSFESFKSIGLAKTYNQDFQVPDSAGTMTAMMAGEKTSNQSSGRIPTTSPPTSVVTAIATPPNSAVG